MAWHGICSSRPLATSIRTTYSRSDWTEAYGRQAGLISKEDIIIDAKSGVSGAGRSAKQNLLYTEIAEGLNCYGVTRHRHMPEIEQVSSCL